MVIFVRLYYWLILCLVVVGLFAFVVLVRITTPRFKLESLSKLSWGPSLAVIVLTLIAYALGFFWG